MMRLNILFVFHGNVDPEKSGVARVNHNLATEFIAQGANVYAITELDGNNLIYTNNYIYPSNIIDSKENIEYLKKICVDNKISHIIVSLPSANRYINLVSSVKGSVKIIGHMHNSPLSIYSRFYFLQSFSLSSYRITKVIAFYIKKIRHKKARIKMMNVVDKMVLLSPSYISELEEVISYNNQKLCYIPNPFPAIVKQEEQPRLKNQLLFVGRIDEKQKRISLLLKIWKKVSIQIPEWSLVIVGGGSELDYWKEEARRMKLVNYSFKGFCKPDEYYRESPIILMTSEYEGFPMVLVEGMQYGCVPIAFGTFAALGDLVKNKKNGYIIREGDLNGYISAIIELTNNPSLQQTMGKSAIEKAKSFETSKVVPLWMDLFKQIQ